MTSKFGVLNLELVAAVVDALAVKLLLGTHSLASVNHFDERLNELAALEDDDLGDLTDARKHLLHDFHGNWVHDVGNRNKQNRVRRVVISIHSASNFVTIRITPLHRLAAQSERLLFVVVITRNGAIKVAKFYKARSLVLE